MLSILPEIRDHLKLDKTRQDPNKSEDLTRKRVREKKCLMYEHQTYTD